MERSSSVQNFWQPPDGGANCSDGEEAEDESKLAERLQAERLELLARYMPRPLIRLLKVGCGLAPAKMSSVATAVAQPLKCTGPG